MKPADNFTERYGPMVSEEPAFPWGVLAALGLMVLAIWFGFVGVLAMTVKFWQWAF